MEDKMYQHSRYLLGRLDAQYDKVNTKISLYLVINAALIALLGGSLIKDFIIPDTHCITLIIYILSLVSSAASMAILIFAAAPYMPKASDFEGDPATEGIATYAVSILRNESKNKSIKLFARLKNAVSILRNEDKDKNSNAERNPSNIFFGDIAKRESSFINQYCALFNGDISSADYPDEIKADLLAQIFVLAKGLAKRNCLLKVAIITMVIAIVLAVALLIFIAF